MADLAAHFAYLADEYAAAKAAPLSTRKAMLVALLVDAYADRLISEHGQGSDILAFRANLGAHSRALSLIFALAAGRRDGALLIIETVEIPIMEYQNLDLEDFMVSLYNAHTIQMIRIVLDGTARDAHAVLAEAIEYLRTVSFDPPPIAI